MYAVMHVIVLVNKETETETENSKNTENTLFIYRYCPFKTNNLTVLLKINRLSVCYKTCPD